MSRSSQPSVYTGTQSLAASMNGLGKSLGPASAPHVPIIIPVNRPIRRVNVGTKTRLTGLGR